MKVPVSWLKDFVDINIPVEELAERLTLAGLETDSIKYIGLPGADLEWDREKLVLAHILRVEQHPNADKLVMATVDYGADEPEVVVTGAPNLFPYKDQGSIAEQRLMSPLVMEGATVYDGHAKEPGKKMKLKGREIRGIMNRHMLCSELELGISEEHDGIIIAQEDAPPGTPLVDLWGDVILDIELTPNLIRCANILGVAREVAALTGETLRYPDWELPTLPDISDRLVIETTEPSLNPRFTTILIEGIEVKPSPYWMQRRLLFAGMRPISNIVDISNYVMLEMGQPNHAFDWDVLQRRASEYNPGGPVNIVTRLAEQGEEVLTLDGKTHKMNDFSILVTDPKSNISIGGVMGGGETEVTDDSKNILLEAAAWNFINIRRTTQALNLYSEAAYRFSRGIHPAQSWLGAARGAKLMMELAGGTAVGQLDYHPLPAEEVVVDLPQSEVTRLLGIELDIDEIIAMLTALEFKAKLIDSRTGMIRVIVPDHRLDISTDETIGRADLVEEIARVYGYDRIPVTEIADELPPQRNNDSLDREEAVRDLLVNTGLREVITYRLTTPEHEARLLGDDYVQQANYVQLANPSTPERAVMRHSVLNSVLEVVAENTKFHNRVQVFEVGHIYLPNKNGEGESAILPDEPRRLAIAMTGPRDSVSWLPNTQDDIDFFDIKGVVEALVSGLHAAQIEYRAATHRAFYPGRTAELVVNGHAVGIFGQLLPTLGQHYGMKIEMSQPVLAADIDLDLLLEQVPPGHVVRSIPRFPPVQQDIALIVDESVSAEQVEAMIRQTGKPMVTDVTLFDVYRGEQIGAKKKSLAYSLTYQSDEQTLTDKAVAKKQQQIVKRLDKELGAKLRG